MITVFTPTYNRAYTLPRLYESLLKKDCFDFEWLVINDGSTDNTDELFKQWVNNATFLVRYIKVANGGKQRAINRALTLAKGEYFFIVDSDDWLDSKAISFIKHAFATLPLDKSLIGLSGIRGGRSATKRIAQNRPLCRLRRCLKSGTRKVSFSGRHGRSVFYRQIASIFLSRLGRRKLYTRGGSLGPNGRGRLPPAVVQSGNLLLRLPARRPNSLHMETAKAQPHGLRLAVQCEVALHQTMEAIRLLGVVVLFVLLFGQRIHLYIKMSSPCIGRIAFTFGLATVKTTAETNQSICLKREFYSL